MANIDKTKTVAPEYTSVMLFDQLYMQYQAEGQGNEEGKAQTYRDIENKFKVIKHIIELVNKSPNEYKNPIEREVKREVEINSSLFGYTYYLAAQRNFDYTWSYMRKQMEGYTAFLIFAGRFIQAMVEDINSLYAEFGSTEGFSLVFNDIFNVAFSDSCVDASLIWKQFFQINSIKKCYYIKAQIDSTTLLTQKRIYEDADKRTTEMDKFIKNIKWLLTEGTIKRK